MESEKTICIFGSRKINNYAEMERIIITFMELLHIKPVEFVSGEAKNSPDMVNNILSLKLLNKEAEKKEPNWKRYNRGAGLVRNEEMAGYLQEKKNGLAIGFWDGISKGTFHMANQCIEKQIPFILFSGLQLSQIFNKGYSKEEFKELYNTKDDFYNSLEWGICRILVLKRDNYECKLCHNVPAKYVHHINDPFYYPEICLDLENLLTLCKDCHLGWHSKK
jgi:5-methylcytosine-specific restriction enzyme A